VNDPLYRKEKFYSKYKEADFNKFEHPLTSFLKVSVMISGEYEASQISYKRFWFGSVFLFVFIMNAFMLNNFMNGLAINDVQVVSKKLSIVNLSNVSKFPETPKRI
jgi:hypothetical protein